MNKTVEQCILVVGPESSGTRWLSGLLGQHPLIRGPDGGHEDPLDEIWSGGADRMPSELMAGGHRALLTRRSLPAGESTGAAAKFLRFVDLHRFHRICLEEEIELILLVTSRSPHANLTSWTASRQSVQGSESKARIQYWAAYQHIFSFTRDSGVRFWITSLEAVMLDGVNYLNSLFNLLSLPDHAVEVAPRLDVNLNRYGVSAAEVGAAACSPAGCVSEGPKPKSSGADG